ncbi:unnamed protein product [Durusdinium trenchii]|uniref:Uncharacterized protein n=1 Tax=Durusdinium trenchii TaxID=1381693 RepID=A0ABP0IIM9_9DINO
MLPVGGSAAEQRAKRFSRMRRWKEERQVCGVAGTGATVAPPSVPQVPGGVQGVADAVLQASTVSNTDRWRATPGFACSGTLHGVSGGAAVCVLGASSLPLVPTSNKLLSSLVRNKCGSPRTGLRLATDQVEPNQECRAAVESVVENVKEKLALQGKRICVKFTHLEILAPGSFELQDTWIATKQGVVARLLIRVPTDHNGGAFTVALGSDQASFFQSNTSAVSFCAFSSECLCLQHPIDDGFLLSLHFELVNGDFYLDDPVMHPNAILSATKRRSTKRRRPEVKHRGQTRHPGHFGDKEGVPREHYPGGQRNEAVPQPKHARTKVPETRHESDRYSGAALAPRTGRLLRNCAVSSSTTTTSITSGEETHRPLKRRTIEARKQGAGQHNRLQGLLALSLWNPLVAEIDFAHEHGALEKAEQLTQRLIQANAVVSLSPAVWASALRLCRKYPQSTGLTTVFLIKLAAVGLGSRVSSVETGALAFVLRSSEPAVVLRISSLLETAATRSFVVKLLCDHPSLLRWFIKPFLRSLTSMQGLRFFVDEIAREADLLSLLCAVSEQVSQIEESAQSLGHFKHCTSRQSWICELLVKASRLIGVKPRSYERVRDFALRHLSFKKLAQACVIGQPTQELMLRCVGAVIETHRDVDLSDVEMVVQILDEAHAERLWQAVKGRIDQACAACRRTRDKDSIETIKKSVGISDSFASRLCVALQSCWEASEEAEDPQTREQVENMLRAVIGVLSVPRLLSHLSWKRAPPKLLCKTALLGLESSKPGAAVDTARAVRDLLHLRPVVACKIWEALSHNEIACSQHRVETIQWMLSSWICEIARGDSRKFCMPNARICDAIAQRMHADLIDVLDSFLVNNDEVLEMSWKCRGAPRALQELLTAHCSIWFQEITVVGTWLRLRKRVNQDPNSRVPQVWLDRLEDHATKAKATRLFRRCLASARDAAIEFAAADETKAA